MPSRRFIALSIGVCLAGGLQAQPDQDLSPQIQKIDSSVIDNHSVPPRTYWTQERMEKAKPAPLPWYGEVAGGPAGDTLAPSDDCRLPGGLPFLTEISKHPYASAGRLFFNTGSEDQFCTAEFTGSDRTLLTAAHCVRDRAGEWYQRFYFVQGYDQGKGQGVELDLVATWRKYWTPTIKRAFDYAFFHTKAPSNSKWFPLGTPGPHLYWLSIGYARNTVSSEKLAQIMGPRGTIDPAEGIVQMLGNPMDASGGAWIANASLCSSTCNEVVGLTASRSFRNCELISPLFNGETRLLLDHVQRLAV